MFDFSWPVVDPWTPYLSQKYFKKCKKHKNMEHLVFTYFNMFGHAFVQSFWKVRYAKIVEHGGSTKMKLMFGK